MGTTEKQSTLIGQASCPVCNERARVSLSKKQWPVLTCQHCGIQLFVRGNRSDQLIRASLVTEPAPAPEPATAPLRNVTAPTPTAKPVTAAPAPAAAAPAPQSTPAPVRRGWGLFPGL